MYNTVYYILLLRLKPNSTFFNVYLKIHRKFLQCVSLIVKSLELIFTKLFIMNMNKFTELSSIFTFPAHALETESITCFVFSVCFLATLSNACFDFCKSNCSKQNNVKHNYIFYIINKIIKFRVCKI